MKKLIIGTLSIFLIICTTLTVFAQTVERQTGCIPFTKSDGRLHCAVIDMKWDDANNRIVVQSLDVDTAGDFLYAGTAIDSTAVEINAATDVSARIVTLTGATTMVQATHEGRILLLGEVGGDASLTVTLLAATGSGGCYHFKISVVNTSNYVIQVTTDDTIDGSLVVLQDAADTVVGWETAATSDTITMNATTQGGVSIGDWLELCDMATDQWSVTGTLTGSGTEITPFSAGVS